MKYAQIYAVFIFILIIGMIQGLAQERSPEYADNAAKGNAAEDKISIENRNSSDREITNIFRKYIGSMAQPPKERYIIFRIDDIAAFWSDNTAINVTETFRARKTPLVLGVIPVNRFGQELQEDKEIKSYLSKIKSDQNIEFALHGYNHETDEFKDISYEDADLKISGGISILEKTLEITPQTFIPPYNIYNDDTVSALKKNSRDNTTISSGYYDILSNIAFTGSDDLLYLPQTTDIYDYTEDHLHPLETIVNSCEYAISRYNICVITIHHTRFTGSGAEIDAEKIELLYSIIDWAKKKEEQGMIKIARFKDISPSDLK